MQKLLPAIILLSSFSSFANSSDTQVKKAIECFKNVTVQISIVLSQAHHGAKPNSKEEKAAKALLDKFTDTVEGFIAVPTACAENTESEELKLACIAQTYKRGTLDLAKKHKTMSIVRSTPACN